MLRLRTSEAINSLRMNILYKSAFFSFSQVIFWLCNFWGKNICAKDVLKMLMKLIADRQACWKMNKINKIWHTLYSSAEKNFCSWNIALTNWCYCGNNLVCNAGMPKISAIQIKSQFHQSLIKKVVSDFPI